MKPMRSLYKKLFHYVQDKRIWAYFSMALSAAAVCSYMGAYWFLWQSIVSILVIPVYEKAMYDAIIVVILMILRGILCDVFIAFPSLIIAIAVIGVLGNGLQNIAVSVVIATWAWFVRVVRSYSVQEMGKDYILAARISGCNTGKLVFRHLIPNILPQFLVYVSTGVASSIIMVSSFAFLGLGLPSGTPEWGAMLNDARTALYSHPELLIYPGLCIFVTAAGFNLFGEALRDILTPEEDSL